MNKETDLNRKTRILESAREQFANRGFSKVTTDEIASELGISKKTLYKHFPKKETLLQEVMEWTMYEIRQGAEKILNDDRLEFTEKLESIMTFIGGQVSRYLTKPFLRDIKRSAPELWARFEAFRKEQINSKFSNLITLGIKIGVFRKDVNQQLVVLVYLNAIQNIIHPETLSHLPFTASEAFESIIKIIFEGILTDHGRQNFAKKLGEGN